MTICICANLFSKSIYDLFLKKNNLTKSYTYQSYEKLSLIHKLFRIFMIIARSYYARIFNIKVTLFIPHCAGSFNKIINILHFDKIVIIDDGVGLLYSNPFHNLYLKPLSKHKKFAFFLACSDHSLDEIGFSGFNRLELNRKDVVLKMLKIEPFHKSVNHYKNYGVIIDAGYWSKKYLINLLERSREIYKAPFIIISHPSRKDFTTAEKLKYDIYNLNYPCEFFIIKNINNIKEIVTDFSTVIVNLATILDNLNIIFVEPGASPYLELKILDKIDIKTISIGDDDWVGIIGNKLDRD